MNRAQKKRWTLLLGLLAISSASAFWAPNENGEANPTLSVKKPNQERGRKKPKNIEASELQLDTLKRNSSPETATDIFPGKSWYVPPPPSKPVPPPPPTPPPIPFVYLGKMLEDGKLLVFMSKQERNLVVREGDVIEGTYRVESILPPVMTLTYLPLNMKQTFPIGAFN
ncbi:MAG: secretion system X translation initiation factor [Gammaproteobacteria bacterium]|nr:secretion system X translation initiation factor [Gammaproteobacteria bacterium]MBU1978588.1 secretion system X translation initiation factor [Gammaproteobacteria bacterium]